eukprot:jgi/Chrzof1/1462/Cz10g08240.t1
MEIKHPDRVKTAKALVAPVTQVTRVQIPALTNLSGHTEFRAQRIMCKAVPRPARMNKGVVGNLCAVP